jgi:nucleoside-diphosphate-sugar epimerase
MRDGAFQQLAFASATGAVLATVGQADTGTNRSGEDGFAFLADKLPTARLNSYFESHTIPTMKNEVKEIRVSRARFAKPRLLILGCGDVGMRLLPLVRDRFRVFAVTSQASRCEELRAAGAVPIVADLDQPDSITRLARLASRIVHFVPPQAEGETDKRTRQLTAILPDHVRVIYVSTTGVYGDCGGAWIDETRPVNPQSDRARRRVDAERALRIWAKRSGSRLTILRVPGIYAADRLPLERLQKGTPALVPDEDVYTNHIHADDLARIVALALFRASNRLYNAVDDSEMKMGDYFDAAAQAFDLPKPPRISREELAKSVSAASLSFMSESRRIGNARMKNELGVRLRYARVRDLLNELQKQQ